MEFFRSQINPTAVLPRSTWQAQKDAVPPLRSPSSTVNQPCSLPTAVNYRKLSIAPGWMLWLQPSVISPLVFFPMPQAIGTLLLGSPIHPAIGGKCPSWFTPSSSWESSPVWKWAPFLSFPPLFFFPSASRPLFHPLRTLCLSLWDPL